MSIDTIHSLKRPAPRPSNTPKCRAVTIQRSTSRSIAHPVRFEESRQSQPVRFPDPRAAPPACEAIQTNLLWQRVRRAKVMPQTQAPRYAMPTNSSPARGCRGKSSNRENSSIADTATSSLPSVTTYTSIESRNPKITGKTFRENVFQRYGISVTSTASIWSPYQHFGTQDPNKESFDGTVYDWYKSKHKYSSVWLDLDQRDAERIAGQYRNMRARGAKEAKLSLRGKNYFFHEDDVFGPEDTTRCSSTYFELEWAPKPDDRHLRCPPVLIDVGQDFTFNTNPDCTYWLNTRQMISDYQDKIGMLTYVLSGPAVAAPYLTIEFKKDGMLFEVAENQLAVSSTLILYNRFRLRCERLRACGQTGSEQAFDDIKHYGIAFKGSIATFYIAKPVLRLDEHNGNLEEAWAGCTLDEFTDADACTPRGVNNIKQWVNEIHNWGLSTHSSQFVIDIKGLLVRTSGGRDQISLLPDEILALGLSDT